MTIDRIRERDIFVRSIAKQNHLVLRVVRIAIESRVTWKLAGEILFELISHVLLRSILAVHMNISISTLSVKDMIDQVE